MKWTKDKEIEIFDAIIEQGSGCVRRFINVLNEALKIAEFKACSRCKKAKPRSEFHKRGASRDGLNYTCKDCKMDDSYNKIIERQSKGQEERTSKAKDREDLDAMLSLLPPEEQEKLKKEFNYEG